VPSRFTLAPLAVSFVFLGCSSGTPLPYAEGDPGAGSEAITVSARSGVCNRAKVMASVTGARRTVLVRGFSWLDQNVPYSQSRTFNGYRTDCSGFVSMCWETGTSHTTAVFASGGGNTAALRSWNELSPGDALVRRGHMMLFTGWADSAKSGVCVLEQASTASDMQFRVRAVASLRGEAYKPIRSRALAGAGVSSPSPSPSEAEPADESTQEPSGTEEAPVADPPDETSPPPNKPAPNKPAPNKPAPDLNTPEPGTAADETAEPAREPAADEPDDAAGTGASSSGGTNKTTTSKKKGSAGNGTEDETAAFAAPPSACAVTARGPRSALPAARGGTAFVALALAALVRRRHRRAR
jgi:hypothetical protein